MINCHCTKWTAKARFSAKLPFGFLESLHPRNGRNSEPDLRSEQSGSQSKPQKMLPERRIKVGINQVAGFRHGCSRKGAGLIMTIPANKRSEQVQIVSLQTAQNAD